MMSVYELRDFAILMLATLAPALLAVILIARFRPAWSTRKAVFLSATPLPALVAGFCVAIFVNATMSWQEDCGVDACGMAMMAASFVFIYALAAFVIGLLIAWPVHRLARRRSSSAADDGMGEIFE